MAAPSATGGGSFWRSGMPDRDGNASLLPHPPLMTGRLSPVAAKHELMNRLLDCCFTVEFPYCRVASGRSAPAVRGRRTMTMSFSLRFQPQPANTTATNSTEEGTPLRKRIGPETDPIPALAKPHVPSWLPRRRLDFSPSIREPRQIARRNRLWAQRRCLE